MKKLKHAPYFEGWYFKQQEEENVIAVIAAIHNGQASVQVNTVNYPYNIEYGEDYNILEVGTEFEVRIGNNSFSNKGIELDIMEEHFSITGELQFHHLHRPSKSIMGPFAYIPFMETNHQIFSLYHKVLGRVAIYNEQGAMEEVSFVNGLGYIEGDKGKSFPEKYIWTQCGCPKGSLRNIIVAIAEIKYKGIPNFLGCTSVLYYHGKEYYISTFRGAKVIAATKDYFCIVQGKRKLEGFLINIGESHLLAAPKLGKMNRRIKESVNAEIRYKLTEADRVIFDINGINAGWESEGTEI